MFAENDVIFLSKFAMIEDVNTRQMNLQSFKLALYDSMICICNLNHQ